MRTPPLIRRRGRRMLLLAAALLLVCTSLMGALAQRPASDLALPSTSTCAPSDADCIPVEHRHREPLNALHSLRVRHRVGVASARVSEELVEPVDLPTLPPLRPRPESVYVQTSAFLGTNWSTGADVGILVAGVVAVLLVLTGCGCLCHACCCSKRKKQSFETLGQVASPYPDGRPTLLIARAGSFASPYNKRKTIERETYTSQTPLPVTQWQTPRSYQAPALAAPPTVTTVTHPQPPPQPLQQPTPTYPQAAPIAQAVPVQPSPPGQYTTTGRPIYSEPAHVPQQNPYQLPPATNPNLNVGPTPSTSISSRPTPTPSAPIRASPAPTPALTPAPARPVSRSPRPTMLGQMNSSSVPVSQFGVPAPGVRNEHGEIVPRTLANWTRDSN